MPSSKNNPTSVIGTPSRRKRVVNLRLLLTTIILIAIICPLAYWWYRYQVGRSAATLLDRVEAYESEENWSEAARSLQRYVLLRPDDREARVRLVEAYGHTAKTIRAKQRLTQMLYQALGIEPNRNDLRLQLAENLLEVQQYAAAEKEARKILEAEAAEKGDHPAARRVIALSLVARARPGGVITLEKAGIALDEALVDLPGDIELASITADYLRRYPDALKDKEVEIASYTDQIMDRMVEVNPKDPKAFLARYQYAKRYTPASAQESDITTALELDPDNVEALLLAANQSLGAEGGKGRDDAGDYLRHIINSQPEDPRGYLGLAQLLAQSNDLEEAAKILQQGRQAVGEDSMDILVTLVGVLIDARKFDESERYIDEIDTLIRDRSADLPNTMRQALENRLRLLRARLALGRGQWNPAIAGLKAVLASSEQGSDEISSPEHLQAIDLLGRTMTALNRWELAASYWDQLTKQLPQQAAFLRLAAHAHLRAGRPNEAMHRLEQFLQSSEPSEDVMVDLAQAHLLRQLREPRTGRNWTEFLAVLADAKNRAPERWELVLVEADYLLVSDAADAQQRTLELLHANEDKFAENLSFSRGLVRLYGQLGEKEDVDRALSRYEKLDPSPVNRANVRTNLLLQAGRYDEADQELVKLISILDKKEDKLQIERMRVEVAIAAGKVESAKDQVAKLIDASTRDEELLKMAIDVALMARDYESAKNWEVLLSGLDLVDDVGFRLLRARRLLTQYADLTLSDRDDLAGLITTLQTERPRSPAVAVLVARHAELRRDFRQAITEYQRAIELGDDRPATLERLVSLLYGEERYNEADEYLARLTNEQPQNASLDILAISLATRRNRIDEALDLAKASVERNPNDAMPRVWLGNLLLLKGEEDESERVFVETVKQFPKDIRAWNGLLTLMVRTRSNDEAKQFLRALIGNPSLPDTTRYFLAAQGYELLGDVEEAKKQYEAAIQSAPENLAIRLRYTNMLHTSDVVAARAQLEQIIQIDPKNNEARRRLATILASSGKDEDWNRAFQLLRQGDGDPGQSAVIDNRLRALLLARRGRTRAERLLGIEAARKILEGQMEQATTGAEDLDRLALAGILEQEAILREDLKLIEAAREQFRHLVDRAQPPVNYLVMYVEFLLRHAQSSLVLADDSPQAQDHRSVILNEASLRLDELRDAQRREGGAEETLVSLGLQVHLLKAEDRIDDAANRISEYAKERESEIKLDSDRARFYLEMGNLYTLLDRDAEAETWYRQLVALRPGAYIFLIQSLSNQGKAQDAIDICLEEAKENPSPQVATVLAQLSASAELDPESVEEARTLIESALKENGEDVNLISAYAVMQVSQGNPEEAIRLFRQALELSPDDTLILNNLATLLAERPNEYTEALERIDQAIAIAGRLPGLLDTQGTIYLRSGDPEKAVACLEEATAGRASDPRYYFHLAAAYLEVSKPNEAREAFNKAQELGLDRAILTTGDQELLTHLKDQLK